MKSDAPCVIGMVLDDLGGAALLFPTFFSNVDRMLCFP
jgi:hypothetical protein